MRASILIGIPLVYVAGILPSHAADIYREPWHWSTTIPAAVLLPNPRPIIRDSRAFDRFHFGEHTTMSDVVLALGAPDGFAPQYPVTHADGVPVGHVHAGPEAGTFRYVLRDSGEFWIVVSDFRTVTAVIRYRRQGSSEVIYAGK